MITESLEDCITRNDAAPEGTEDFHWYEPHERSSSSDAGITDGRVVVVATSLASALIGLGEVINFNGPLGPLPVSSTTDPRDMSRTEQRYATHFETYFDSDRGCYLIRATLWWEDVALKSA